ncbi:GNAT family N-acetyltransferase [Cupriavidus basilensis]|uniref:GNAT family N-acetyltransferase n=1 Tax=Cupriavidus basilensis TaxID=68895 RepID=UPI0039F654BC
MPETLKIRKATKADAPALCSAERTTAAAPGLLLSRQHEFHESAFAQKIEVLSTIGAYLVAEVNGKLVGHALLEPLGLESIAHVFTLTIVVHPGHLGLGIGTALMAALLEWADRTPAVKKIELRCAQPTTGLAFSMRVLALFRKDVSRSGYACPTGHIWTISPWPGFLSLDRVQPGQPPKSEAGYTRLQLPRPGPPAKRWRLDLHRLHFATPSGVSSH